MKKSLKYRLLYLLLSCFIGILMVVQHANPAYSSSKESKNILLLTSASPELPWPNNFTKGLGQGLKDLNDPSFSCTLYRENMDIFRFKRNLSSFRTDMMRKYKYKDLDLTLTLGIYAAEFVSKNKEYLFDNPNTPVIHLMMSQGGKITDQSNSRAFYWGDNNVFPRTLELIFNIHPETAKVVVLGGFDKQSELSGKILKENFKPYARKAEIEFYFHLPLQDLLEEVAGMEKGTVIYYLPFQQDIMWNVYSPVEALQKIDAIAKVPIYSNVDSFLGKGIVGGNIRSAELVGKSMAGIAKQVIKGEGLEAIALENRSFKADMFDWRKLKRFGIKEADLPKNSIVKFRELSLFEKFRYRIIVIAILILFQASLIVFLMINLRLRKRIQAELTAHKESLEVTVIKRTAELANMNEELNQEIDERRQMEEALRETKDRLETILYSMPVGVLIIDAETEKVIDTNPAVIAMRGGGIESGTELNILMKKAETEGPVESSSAIDIDEKECDFIRADGSSFPIHKTNIRVLLDGKECVIICLADISAQKESERERIQKEKLQGAIETAGAVCHELNQPLMGITGYSELLLLDSPEDDSRISKIQKIKILANRMGEITGKLMRITRYETKDYLEGRIIDIDAASEEGPDFSI